MIFESSLHPSRDPPGRRGLSLHRSMDGTPVLQSLGSEREAWVDEEVAALLDVWGDTYIRVKRENLGKRHWETVVREVNSRLSHQREQPQMKNKIDSLKKRYKREKLSKGESERSVNSWKWYDRCDMLWGTPKRGREVVAIGNHVEAQSEILHRGIVVPFFPTSHLDVIDVLGVKPARMHPEMVDVQGGKAARMHPDVIVDMQGVKAARIHPDVTYVHGAKAARIDDYPEVSARPEATPAAPCPKRCNNNNNNGNVDGGKEPAKRRKCGNVFAGKNIAAVIQGFADTYARVEQAKMEMALNLEERRLQFLERMEERRRETEERHVERKARMEEKRLEAQEKHFERKLEMHESHLQRHEALKLELLRLHLQVSGQNSKPPQAEQQGVQTCEKLSSSNLATCI